MEIDTFPYKKYSLQEPIENFFIRARNYRPNVQIKPPSLSQSFLKPGKVVSRVSREEFIRHFPLTWKSKTWIIQSRKEDYWKINIVTDFFTEYARVRDYGAYETQTPYEFWIENQQKIKSFAQSQGLKDSRIVENFAREYIWKYGPKEARQGKITNYLSLFAILGSRKVLDPSAAWGDRLIAALASKTVEAYVGVDPHSLLPEGWKQILTTFGPLSRKNLKNFVMINSPFEIPSLKILDQTEAFDTVLISTAPLFGDVYDISNPNQAANKHGKSFKSYVKGFLIPYLRKSISLISPLGFLCITVLDRDKDKYYITELKLLLTEYIGMGSIKYLGVIWWAGDSGSMTPWWIFQKSSISKTRFQEVLKMLQNYKSFV